MYNNLSDEEVRTYLQMGTLAVAIYADTNFMSYAGGVYSCARAATASDLNHGVQLIGYDASNNWIIKNSWDTTWGVDGFGYVTSNSAGNCAITAEVHRLSGWRMLGCVVMLIAALTMI